MRSPLVMLDIDGVLNHRAWLTRPYRKTSSPQARMKRQIDPACIERLNRIIDAAGADVVISSAWRAGVLSRDARLIWVLEALGFKGLVLGVTPDLRSRSSSADRGHEIQSWLDAHGRTAEEVVILDDDADMAHLLPRLVRTSFETGLTDEHVERAIGMLGTESAR